MTAKEVKQVRISDVTGIPKRVDGTDRTALYSLGSNWDGVSLGPGIAPNGDVELVAA